MFEATSRDVNLFFKIRTNEQGLSAINKFVSAQIWSNSVNYYVYRKLRAFKNNYEEKLQLSKAKPFLIT